MLKAAIEQSLGSSPNHIHKWVIQVIHRLSLGGDTLDFGAGTAQLTKLLRKENRIKSLSAVDLYPCPADLEKEVRWLEQDLNSANLPASAFDLAIAVEVLEHLENPRSALRAIHQSLRPNGYLIATTPNNESIRSLLSFLLRGYFVDFGPSNYPAHITPLLEIDLLRMASENGFEIVEVKYSGRGTLPKLTSLTWQTFSAGTLRGKRFSDQVMLVARKLGT